MPGSDVVPPNVVLGTPLPADASSYDLTQDMVPALQRAEERHFWHLARNRFITSHLARLGLGPPASILELGSGSGAVSAHLARAGFRVTGVDGHLPLVLCAAERAPEARWIVHDLTQGPPPLAGERFDAVGLFDVIEHLDAPGEALAGALEHVRPGGLLVGTVPALMMLWSQGDALSGHRVRYERKTLAPLLEALPGARLLEILDFNRALVPMLWATRRKLTPGATAKQVADASLRVPAAPVNSALIGLLAAEYAIGDRWPSLPLPGASLWFALRRDLER